MKYKLLFWKWSDEYASFAQRKRQKIKFDDITAQFKAMGRHPAIGPADIDAFIIKADQTFGKNPWKRKFRIKRKNLCVIASYKEEVRVTLVPQLAEMGKMFNLNACEFFEDE